MIDGSKLIFIVGIPRSGTTWVHSIISSHPECRLLLPEMLGMKKVRDTRETGLFVAQDYQIVKFLKN